MTEQTITKVKHIKTDVTFKSSGLNLKGNLYFPNNYSENQRYPAIVVAGPMATVKEQAAGTFAKALADKGFITLAFDYRTFGNSEGEPRQFEDPASKTEDVKNAISFLYCHKNVDNKQIGALGICASASYMADALQSDRRISAFATVSGHFSLREATVTNPLVPEEFRQAMYIKSNEARQAYYETGVAEPNDMLMPDMPDAPPESAGIFICEQYDVYFRRAYEAPNYSNHLVPFSFEQIARSHALDYAPMITVPYLGVVGELAFTREFTERFIQGKIQGYNEIKIIEGCSHFRAYDNPKDVAEGAEALDAFFTKHLQ